MTERVLRSVAIVIALLSLLDPPLQLSRTAPPVVSLVSDGKNAAALRDVREQLDDRFRVVDGVFPAGATVLVGSKLPEDAGALASPVVAVVPDVHAALSIASVHAPATAPLGVQTTLSVTVELPEIRTTNDTLIVRLESGGVLLATTRHAAVGSTVRVTLPFTPVSTGAQLLEFAATLERNASEVARTHVVRQVYVYEERIRVLVTDARASWMSTFVRRALESSERFDVVSRVATSRGIALSSGSAPSADELARLTPTQLDAYDVVIVGAPDAATASTVQALERFMRVRGGVVLLLFDNTGASAFDHLIGHGSWRAPVLTSPRSIRRVGDTTTLLRVSEAAAPTTLPADAGVLATMEAEGADTPAVFHVSVGAGRLVVSSALDAWRYREPEQSAFMRAWPELVGDLAAMALPPITVAAGTTANNEVRVNVWVRDAAVIPSNDTWAGSVSGGFTSNSRTESLALYPTAQLGMLEGRFRAPDTTALVMVSASVTNQNGVTAQQRVELMFRGLAESGDVTQPDEFLPLWIAAHGGLLVPHAELGQLSSRLDSLVGGEKQAATVFPMRSPWWLLPFSFALGAEWWLRRRRGWA